MREDDQPNEQNVTRDEPGLLSRRTLIFAAVVLAAFLIGLVPMWLTARDRASQLAETERRLNISTLENKLSSAVIDARRGEYEAARRSASDFFTTLRTESERGDSSSLTAAQLAGVRPLFDQRDDIITLLARSDPAAADRLANFYIAYRNAISGTPNAQ